MHSKSGVSHTAYLGLSHTGTLGVTQTVFRGMEEKKKGQERKDDFLTSFPFHASAPEAFEASVQTWHS